MGRGDCEVNGMELYTRPPVSCRIHVIENIGFGSEMMLNVFIGILLQADMRTLPFS